ncbi:hypothetical protein SLS62_009657 [Diatrype stigma]|uniref:Rhodanese domain-containing protein n=1 Tax=Diatrype stigma TaxID=117547 RepID=A0AAN9UD33_9PEZI
MTENHLNVFTGPDSVKNYFDPDQAPPLPLVEIPDVLNPYRGDGVRIYAKMMTMHPANNVKCMPALNLLEHGVVPGKTKTIVEYSSGSTVISMSMVARVYHGISDTRAFLSNKTSVAKLRLMQFFGLDITLFGGPSQPEPTDHRGGIRRAEQMADSDDTINPNQYTNDNNWKSHIRWTGPQILKQLPEINLICAGLGTSGTMTGLGTFFKEAKPSVYRLGVVTAAGDRVPGPRSFSLLAPVEFPWKSSVDHIEHVGSHDSYRLSLDLCRQGIVCGPSSGFNLSGLYQFLAKKKADGTLASDLAADAAGEIHCVFLCCDLPYQYIGEYFDKLGEASGAFPPIRNDNLAKVDLHRYDEAWELAQDVALESFYALEPLSPGSQMAQLRTHQVVPQRDVTVLDLRQSIDFVQGSLPRAINVPLSSLSTSDRGSGDGDATATSPFFDAALLEKTWRELEDLFSADRIAELRGRRTLVVCYDGDTSRVATSVLRAKGVEASNIRGGVKALTTRDLASTSLFACAADVPEAPVVANETLPLVDDLDPRI